MMNKKDLASGFCFLALGLLLVILSMKGSIWTKAGPQECFFPLVIGIIIVGLSGLTVFQSFLAKATGKGEGFIKKRGEMAGVFRLSYYGISMGCYAVLFETLGFLITSSLFLLLVLKVIEKQNWKITLLVGLGSVMTSYFLFRYLLDVPLPEGLIKW